MTQTFTSLLVEIRESIDQSLTPTDLTIKLADALQRAEAYEEEWINDMYEHSDDNFRDYIY